MSLCFLLLLLFFSSFAASDEHLPRPLIIQFPENPNSIINELQNQHEHSTENPSPIENELNQHTQFVENSKTTDNELNQHSHSIANPSSIDNELDQHTHCSGDSGFDPSKLKKLTRLSENPSSNDNEQQQLECTSWRFAVEANNLNPWKTVPLECGEYVKDYVTGKGYSMDLERVSSEAGIYATSIVLGGDGKDAWIFDVDETLLSNMPYYADHGYGLEVFNPVEFDKWVDKGSAPAIIPSLKLYEEVLGLGLKVFFLTGRGEKQRSVTEENLINAGFRTWDRLILRTSTDHGKLATTYKLEKRDEMVKEGYRIAGNSGDQWSDLLGSPMSVRSFKLPNPMYYIP